MTEFTELKNKKAGSSEPLSMRDTQQIALEILHTVAQICEERNLRYYLVYGTLIGAVRHHGFIPWDDDVDIMMPRPDYDKLLEYLEDHIGEYPHLQVFNRKTCPDYPYMITRISDDRYEIRMENEKPFGMGVFIDIYPYDGLGNEQREAIRLEKLARVRPYDLSKYVGCVIWLSWGVKDMYLRKWFDAYTYMPFEQYRFRVPAAYDKILRHTYGDYMQLPPEEDRVGHHYYKAYKKQ